MIINFNKKVFSNITLYKFNYTLLSIEETIKNAFDCSIMLPFIIKINNEKIDKSFLIHNYKFICSNGEYFIFTKNNSIDNIFYIEDKYKDEFLQYLKEIKEIYSYCSKNYINLFLVINYIATKSVSKSAVLCTNLVRFEYTEFYPEYTTKSLSKNFFVDYNSILIKLKDTLIELYDNDTEKYIGYVDNIINNNLELNSRYVLYKSLFDYL